MKRKTLLVLEFFLLAGWLTGELVGRLPIYFRIGIIAACLIGFIFLLIWRKKNR